jgi:hypothetical protein
MAYSNRHNHDLATLLGRAETALREAKTDET